MSTLLSHKHVYRINWITQVGTHLHYMNHMLLSYFMLIYSISLV